jgi:hypothetical protein
MINRLFFLYATEKTTRIIQKEHMSSNRKLFYNINLNITTFHFVIEGKADSQGYKFLYKEVFSYAISLI